MNGNGQLIQGWVGCLFCIYLEYEWIDAAAMCWTFYLP